MARVGNETRLVLKLAKERQHKVVSKALELAEKMWRNAPNTTDTTAVDALLERIAEMTAELYDSMLMGIISELES